MGDELERRHVGPQVFEGMSAGSLKPEDKLAVQAEALGVAGTAHEPKGRLGVVVDIRIELADDVI